MYIKKKIRKLILQIFMSKVEQYISHRKISMQDKKLFKKIRASATV